MAGLRQKSVKRGAVRVWLLTCCLTFPTRPNSVIAGKLPFDCLTFALSSESYCHVRTFQGREKKCSEYDSALLEKVTFCVLIRPSEWQKQRRGFQCSWREKERDERWGWGIVKNPFALNIFWMILYNWISDSSVCLLHLCFYGISHP